MRMLIFPKRIFGANSKHVCGSRWPLEELQFHVFNFRGFCSVLTPHIIKTSCLRGYNQLLAHKWACKAPSTSQTRSQSKVLLQEARGTWGLMQWTPVGDRKQMKRNLILRYADRMCAEMASVFVPVIQDQTVSSVRSPSDVWHHYTVGVEAKEVLLASREESLK